MSKAEEIIEKLQLKKHPEGGYFKEVYRSKESIAKEALPNRFSGDRSFGTSIYFLLKEDDISAWHRIKQDEIWHHYQGSAMVLHTIDDEGRYSKIVVGQNIEKGEMPQMVVPFGCWMAAEVVDKTSYALVGCTTSPGFDFSDFEMAEAKQLKNLYPQHEEIIMKFILKGS